MSDGVFLLRKWRIDCEMNFHSQQREDTDPIKNVLL